MNLVAPFGFFGAGNIGDESTLEGFARLVTHYQKRLKVWVASRNPEHTAQVVPYFRYFKSRSRNLRARWAHFRSAASVIVGGTPIMDVQGAWPFKELVPLVNQAGNQGKPVIFVGTGTESLLREESKQVVSKIFATSVDHWSVRSQRDKQRLTDYGVPDERVTVAADLAWTIDAVSEDFGKGLLTEVGVNTDNRFIAVNLTNEKFVREQHPRLFEQMGTFLDALIEKHDVHILFVANEVREGNDFDVVASNRALSSMKHQNRATLIPNKYWTPEQMRSLIACCHMTISMRYHFCLFSAVQRVPFLALKRSDKVDDLCWDIDWPYGVRLSEINISEMLDMYSDADSNKNSMIDHLRERTELMRERAYKNTVSLDALWSSLKK
jgi:polysaccharide pyruvyl transferase WcaK-like protein